MTAIIILGQGTTLTRAALGQGADIERVSGDDFRARSGKMSVIVRIEPNYPLDALERGLSGHAKLLFSIDTNGRPVEIEIAESTPRKSFGEAGREALKQWRYTPPTLDGEPVIVTGEHVDLSFDVFPG